MDLQPFLQFQQTGFQESFALVVDFVLLDILLFLSALQDPLSQFAQDVHHELLPVVALIVEYGLTIYVSDSLRLSEEVVYIQVHVESGFFLSLLWLFLVQHDLVEPAPSQVYGYVLETLLLTVLVLPVLLEHQYLLHSDLFHQFIQPLFLFSCCLLGIYLLLVLTLHPLFLLFYQLFI